MMGKEGCGSGKLCPVSLGIGFGVAEGLFMLIFAWVGWGMGCGVDIIHEMGTVFHGYAPTFWGGLWGALWGLLEGGLFGLIAGLVYNCCLCRCCCKMCSLPDKPKPVTRSRKSKSS